jgi:hypothetical protein
MHSLRCLVISSIKHRNTSWGIYSVSPSLILPLSSGKEAGHIFNMWFFRCPPPQKKELANQILTGSLHDRTVRSPWHTNILCNFSILYSCSMWCGAILLEMVHHTVTFAEWSSCWWTSCGFSVDHYWKFCLFKKPERWKCASSLINRWSVILGRQFWSSKNFEKSWAHICFTQFLDDSHPVWLKSQNV